MASHLDLTRSQFSCANCRNDTYTSTLFAKSEDGRILVCSKDCFNQYRSIVANRNSTKWYFCFPVTEETIRLYIKVEEQ